MTEFMKKFLERAAYVVSFLAAIFAISVYRERHKPAPPPAQMSAEDAERARKQEEFRKTLAEFDAREAAGHATRVKRLGEAGAKAQEDRCDAELTKVLQTSIGDKKIKPSDLPDCDDK